MADSLRPAAPPKSDRPRNVIWVFGDQHRAQACGYRGCPDVSTPNIDRMARDGVRFDNAVAGAPWCTPFRGSLLTGRYPHQVGTIQTPSPIDTDAETIAEPFKAAGYHTAYFGKWHLHGSNTAVYVPPDRRGGFDHWLGYENNNAQYHVHVHGSGAEEGFRLDGYETDALTDLFVQHLHDHVQTPYAGPEERSDGGPGGPGHYQPFFAVLSVQPPHDPYVAPPQYAGRHRPADITLRPNVPPTPWVRDRSRFDLAGYYAQIENLDHNLGRVRAALTTLGIDRETIVIFFSDHGDMHGSHGQYGKSSPWEESIRIPLLVAGLAGAGLTRLKAASDATVNHVDIAPTTLGLCGIDPPADMAGFNYASHIQAGPEQRSDEEPDSAYLQQLVDKHHPHSVNKPWRGVVTRDGWKYVCFPGHDWLLFNLHDDPYEQHNLAHDDVFKDRRAALHDRLARWIAETGDAFGLPPR